MAERVAFPAVKRALQTAAEQARPFGGALAERYGLADPRLYAVVGVGVGVGLEPLVVASCRFIEIMAARLAPAAGSRWLPTNRLIMIYKLPACRILQGISRAQKHTALSERHAIDGAGRILDIQRPW